jgi:D-3-phosphoglycerate dehydrogenase
LSAQFSFLKEASARLGEFEGLILGTEKFTRPHFEKSKRLRVICKYGVGTDNINMNAAEEYAVKVLNLPGINCAAVAEMALGLMFCAARRIAEGDRLLRKGTWKQLLGFPLKGKTLGMIGTGAIGMTLVRMVAGLEMKILAYDILQSEELLNIGGEYASLNDLLRKSDFITLHLPSNDKTFHLLSENEFNLMKNRAILINTSRGPIVDEKALYHALKAKKIAGAGLDVFEKEPPFESEILQLDNVVCTPHISAYTHETLRCMDEESVKAVSRALETQTL